jgi:hypothetical protein
MPKEMARKRQNECRSIKILFYQITKAADGQRPGLRKDVAQYKFEQQDFRWSQGSIHQ